MTTEAPEGPIIFCEKCGTEVACGALRCKGCGVNFVGPKRARRLTPHVSYGAGPIEFDPDSGEMLSGMPALTFGVRPDDEGDEEE